MNLDGEQIVFGDPQDGVLFDLLANGTLVQVSWPISNRTYWLALDRNGNGRIDDGSELFGNVTPLRAGGVAPHGYAALMELDDNGDGQIDAQDWIFGSLLLWRGPNPSASAAADESIRLSESGVVSLSLAVRESRHKDRWGNEFRFRAKVTMAESAERWTYDVFLVYVSLPNAER